MRKIIDVSHHQPANINWAKVKSDGIDGVIIRAGFGKGNVDEKFHRFIEGAIKAKLPIGIYYFSYAYSVEMADKEADYCLNLIKPYKDKITLPVFFDWEYDSMRYAREHGHKPGRTIITAMNQKFCRVVEKAGYRAGVYYNEDYKDHYLYMNLLDNFVTWYARYTSHKPAGVDLWQYSSKGQVDGISSGTDVNYVMDEKAVFWREKAKQHYQGDYPKLPKRGWFTFGDRGEEVKKVQRVVNWYLNSKMAVDGIYGSDTGDHVDELQKRAGLDKNGKFGRFCLAEVKKAVR